MQPSEAKLARQRTARLAAAMGLILLGFWIVHRFVPALLWALLIAISTWPLYQRLQTHLPARNADVWGAIILSTMMAAVVFVPLGVASMKAAAEAQSLTHWVATIQKSGLAPPEWVGRLPVMGAAITDWWNINITEPGAAQAWLAEIDKSVIVGWSEIIDVQLLHRSIILGFTLLTLFFLYRHGATLATQALSIAGKAFGDAGEIYAVRIVAAVRATVNGLVLVALGEGLLLGVGYAVSGLPHPVLLGALTAILAVIPFAAPVVFAGAALVLFAQGSIAAAIALLVFGIVVLFVADHLVRPAFISGATRLPFLWVLLGILGGLEVFGLLGLFLGPAVMAAAISLWRDCLELAG